MFPHTQIKRTKPVFKIAAIDDQEKFKLPPLPSGAYPYHLDIEKILPGTDKQKMVFHIAGDTGGFQLPAIKHLVVNEMVKQCNAPVKKADRPSFFFHLGDVVYNFGQADQYYPQFFEPYKNYPGPVFAIAGNHDADVDLFDPLCPQSLQAFMKVFCDTEPRYIQFAGDSKRKSNIQPNVYWTLETPLANIIGLYSNAPRFGTITAVQREWFIEELKSAGKLKGEKALVVCIHHSAYSGDTNHGSSLRMQVFLDSAFEAANVYPDIVFSGHVHNYQRFTKQYANGKTLLFIVAGAGGYADLHKMAAVGDPDFPDSSTILNNVALENYCDNAHGFLKVTIEKNENKFVLQGDYYTISINNDIQSTSTLFDSFSVDLRA
jgi:predicted phosphodiesterase